MDEGHLSTGHINPYLCLAVCVSYLNRVEVSEWNFVIDCSEVRIRWVVANRQTRWRGELEEMNMFL